MVQTHLGTYHHCLNGVDVLAVKVDLTIFHLFAHAVDMLPNVLNAIVVAFMTFKRRLVAKSSLMNDRWLPPLSTPRTSQLLSSWINRA